MTVPPTERNKEPDVDEIIGWIDGHGLAVIIIVLAVCLFLALKN